MKASYSKANHLIPFHYKNIYFLNNSKILVHYLNSFQNLYGK